ncbi:MULTISPECIES: hypothetical protein [unclassified Microcoleus]|uniref:hypothetical protein n=1 Tax=unclassified Microcoleus TaxID=2642155 RepID=UPI002FD7160E
MNDENSDDKLVNFLKQNRPNVPDVSPEFEQRVLAAIDRNDAIDQKSLGDSRSIAFSKKSKTFGLAKWAVPSAIAASLLVLASGYRILTTAQIHADEAAHLEAFLVNNWEGALNDSHTENLLDRPQTDLFDYAVTDDTELPTN